MNTRRVFIGIPLSSVLTRRLIRDIQRLPEDVFLPTRAENLHITLLFLGFIKDEALPDLSERLADCLRAEHPFDISFTALVLAPDSADPKMVWLTGEACRAFTALRHTLAKHFLPQQSAAHGRAYPHVTLARIRRGRYRALENKPAIAQAIHYVESVEALTLFESTVIEGHRTYLPLLTVPLGDRHIEYEDL